MEELSSIASISGKSGLFKVLKPGKAGVLAESLDQARSRLVVTNSQQVGVLSDISVYTTTKEGTIPLREVLKKIFDLYKTDIGINVNADNAELKSFMKSILPEYDEQRVYISDIKKLVKWYLILVKELPELFEAAPVENKEG